MQIMGVPPHVYEDLNKAVARPFPPTMFVHMPRDKRTAAAVAADVEALKAQVRKLLDCFSLQPGLLTKLLPSRRLCVECCQGGLWAEVTFDTASVCCRVWRFWK